MDGNRLTCGIEESTKRRGQPGLVQYLQRRCVTLDYDHPSLCSCALISVRARLRVWYRWPESRRGECERSCLAPRPLLVHNFAKCSTTIRATTLCLALSVPSRNLLSASSCFEADTVVCPLPLTAPLSFLSSSEILMRTWLLGRAEDKDRTGVRARCREGDRALRVL